MPLYEYECGKCHRRVEKIQSFSAEPLTQCESCGGPLERLISAPAIQFKGSGWYVTDYAKKSSAAAASSSESKPAGDKAGAAKAGEPTGGAAKSDAAAPNPAPSPAPKAAADSK